MKTQIEEIIKRINSLHHEDPEIPTELDKITHLLSQNLDNTIEVLNTLDEHSINWVCSSFPEISAALESKRFIASIKQSVSPALTVWPTVINGLAPGEGERYTVPTIGAFTECL